MTYLRSTNKRFNVVSFHYWFISGIHVMKHEKVSGELNDVTVCAAIKVSRVPSSIPRDPRSRVTSRVVIRDHRSPIRRNKTRQTCTLKRGAAFSCLSWSGIPFVPLHLGPLGTSGGGGRFLGQPHLPVFLFHTPLLNNQLSVPSMTGDRFRRPVNLLWALVFALPSCLPCWWLRCSFRVHLGFTINRPWTLVARGDLRYNYTSEKTLTAPLFNLYWSSVFNWIRFFIAFCRMFRESHWCQMVCKENRN